MVKKKGKSKRTTLKDKYKIQKRTAETHRKRRREAKRDAAAGKVINKSKKDPGIPNSWPFKNELLAEIQRTREQQSNLEKVNKEKRQNELRMLREHQQAGGTARTVQELVQAAAADQEKFNQLQQEQQVNHDAHDNNKKVSNTELGQQSRRAYLTELKKVIDGSDVILQILDARDPLGSRMRESIENNMILSKPNKKMVLVLNKIDLVPKTMVQKWLDVLRKSHPTIAIQTGGSSKTASATKRKTVEETASLSSSNTPVGMEGLLSLLKNYARISASSKTTITVGIVGYPNTGKSSLVNALKRSRAVGVSPRPGFTKVSQQVVLDKNIRLIDSPGVVFDDDKAWLGNCVDTESMADPIAAVEKLVQRCDPNSLMMTYNIPRFPDTMTFLSLVAKAHGRVLKGGIPDKKSAARNVLKDWNCGKIPYYTPPPMDNTEEARRSTGAAVVVSEFAPEFDVTQFDNVVLKNLKDTDELDFVKLLPQSTSSGAMDTDYADGEMIHAESDDEMDEESDESSEEKNSHKTKRLHLADAEDYDFDDM
jgi:nuclear GTP-binding protein